MKNQKHPDQGRPKTILASSSLFSQLLSLIDRKHFSRLVRETGSEKRSKGFSSWDPSEAPHGVMSKYLTFGDAAE